MKHWLLAAALICFGSSSYAATKLGASLGATGPSVSSTTATQPLSGTFTQTTQIACISGSSVSFTIPTSSGAAIVMFNGGISDGNLAAAISVGIELDGAFVNGETAAKGIIPSAESVAGSTNNMSFNVPITGINGGLHTICLSPFVSAGTGTIESTISVSKLQVVVIP